MCGKVEEKFSLDMLCSLDFEEISDDGLQAHGDSYGNKFEFLC